MKEDVAQVHYGGALSPSFNAWVNSPLGCLGMQHRQASCWSAMLRLHDAVMRGFAFRRRKSNAE